MTVELTTLAEQGFLSVVPQEVLVQGTQAQHASERVGTRQPQHLISWAFVRKGAEAHCFNHKGVVLHCFHWHIQGIG